MPHHTEVEDRITNGSNDSARIHDVERHLFLKKAISKVDGVVIPGKSTKDLRFSDMV